MTWIQTMSNRMTRGLASLSRHMPALSAAPTYEFSGDDVTTLPTNRNRWERPDINSAVGQDPHVTDPAVKVWPERGVVRRET